MTELGTDQNEDEVDAKYRAFLASLSSGLLITVNESDNGSVPYGEMEVDYSKDHGEVYLNGYQDERYRIYFHPELGPRIQELDDEGYGVHENAVVTVEVIGHV